MTGVTLRIPELFNVSEYFLDRHLSEGRGDAVAILFRDHQQTYRQVVEQVNRAANALRKSGIGPGDRVLLLLLDSPTFVAAFWGAIRLGAVPIPTNTLLTGDDYEFMLRDSGARCLVVQDSLVDKVAPAFPRLEELKTVWVSGEVKAGLQGFEDELARSSPEALAFSTRRDDPAFWLYTSGSTGRPKAAIHLHQGMIYCLELYARGVLKIAAGDRTFSTSKLFFAYGLGNALYFPLGVGASTVLLPDRPSPEKIFKTLRRYRPTIFYAVPTLYAALLQAPEAERDAFQSVRCAVSAGEALPAPVLEKFRERFGITILDGIGSTEMLHMFISNQIGDVLPGSSGRTVGGYSARIVDADGNEVPPGQMGELQVRGPSTPAGYWNRPELTRATFRGEWTVTGDKYIRDARGYYWYCGRTDDMMKVSGMWVSPVEVEAALLAHPTVLECAVVGATDREGLTKPKAFVVLKPAAGTPANWQGELEEFLRARLPGYKVPSWFVLTESLPRTATGKIQRFKLREIETRTR